MGLQEDLSNKIVDLCARPKNQSERCAWWPCGATICSDDVARDLMDGTDTWDRWSHTRRKRFFYSLPKIEVMLTTKSLPEVSKDQVDRAEEIKSRWDTVTSSYEASSSRW